MVASPQAMAIECRWQREETVVEKLMRLPEVAKMTGLPENTLRFWRHQGIGPRSARLGRRVVYRECDVVAWVEEQFGN
jgi:predicted DNA-binding transcriptional regulator AlpA